jgi:hypothetical protein
VAIAGRSYPNVPIVTRSSLADAPVLTTPSPIVVSATQPLIRQLLGGGVAVVLRATLIDPPVLTTENAQVITGPAASPTARTFLARSSLVDVVVPTSVTPEAIVVTGATPTPAAQAPILERGSLFDAATPSPIVVPGRAPQPAGVTVAARATLQDDPVLTTRAPLIIVGPGATVLTQGPYTARSSLIDVAPATIATPGPIVVTPPARLPVTAAPILDRGTLQDDPQLTTPSAIVTAAPLRIPVTPQAFISRASFADAVIPSAVTPQPLVVTGPGAARPALPPYLSRSSYADVAVGVGAPAPMVVAAAVKLAAAQPPIVLRATLTDPTVLATPGPLVIARSFRPARTHPFMSRGSLTDEIVAVPLTVTGTDRSTTTVTASDTGSGVTGTDRSTASVASSDRSSTTVTGADRPTATVTSS